ncbi:MAG: hypothetical protein H7Y32_21435, partial [Chloroflexales bacterium]|nr:hypothetical protein [Chloroflexales bacterium]
MPSCFAGTCPELEQAAAHYSRAVALKQTDGDGYALRGLVALSQYNFEAALDDFQQAAANSSNPEQRANQHANIATTSMILAQSTAGSESQRFYQQSQQQFAIALALADRRFVGATPTCTALAERLVSSDDTVSPIMRTPIALNDSTTRAIVAQLGDVCINIGISRAKELLNTRANITNPQTALAWHELASAAIAFRAVANTADKPLERYEALKGVASAWLQLSQFPAPPAGMPDRRTAALMALRTYQEIEHTSPGDVLPMVAAGTAWSALQLGTWHVTSNDPGSPGLLAAIESTDEATYPALQGLIKWFESSQYPGASPTTPSLAYTAAISEALILYDLAISRSEAALAAGEPEATLLGERLDHAYTIRSLLQTSMRTSPEGGSYDLDSYNRYTLQALRDMNNAIDIAVFIGRAPEELAGLRYWRGRLALDLANLWQQEQYGSHDWNELVPLLSSAYSDFSEAAAIDPLPNRRERYAAFWGPWSQALLNDAAHVALSRAALREGDAIRAERELALVQPRAAQRFDKESAAVPDYSFLYAAVRLARGRELLFPNLFTTDDRQAYSALASVAQGIADVESGEYLGQSGLTAASRSQVYEAALDDLEALLNTPKLKLSARDLSQVDQAAAQIAQQLEKVNGGE